MKSTVFSYVILLLISIFPHRFQVFDFTFPCHQLIKRNKHRTLAGYEARHKSSTEIFLRRLGVPRSQETFPQMESHGHVIGIPVSSVSVADQFFPATCTSSSQSKQIKDSAAGWMSKIGETAQGIREHVSLGSNLSGTVKGKLSMGARILHAGGIERDFRQAFAAGEEEKLLQAFQCYLSTTAGPIPGMLFISNQKLAFRSDRSLKLTSPKGVVARVPYKVVIPLGRIKGAARSEDMSEPKKKYIQLVTGDGFEFWFMGFVSCGRCFTSLQQAISALQ